MSKQPTDIWRGLDETSRKAVSYRDYAPTSLGLRLVEAGVDASELFAVDRSAAAVKEIWIPAVEIFARKVHAQRQRGTFSELGRQNEGVLAQIGLWPRQWSGARMYAGSAKGFHVHPPHVP